MCRGCDTKTYTRAQDILPNPTFSVVFAQTFFNKTRTREILLGMMFNISNEHVLRSRIACRLTERTRKVEPYTDPSGQIAQAGSHL